MGSFAAAETSFAPHPKKKPKLNKCFRDFFWVLSSGLNFAAYPSDTSQKQPSGIKITFLNVMVQYFYLS